MKRSPEELIDLNLVEVPFIEKYDLIKELQEVLKETYIELVHAQRLIKNINNFKEHREQIYELSDLLTLASDILLDIEPVTPEQEIKVYKFFQERRRLLREGFYYERRKMV